MRRRVAVTHTRRWAHKLLAEKNGAGSDFLGWMSLPVDYDKEEFARIKAAAERIKDKCDVFIVIGIGGSYLGARAAIEFLKSNLYNDLKKDTPDIYFVGNSINPAYLNEVISICEGRDVCVNVISKSGTTTEPALAFRIGKKLLSSMIPSHTSQAYLYISSKMHSLTVPAVVIIISKGCRRALWLCFITSYRLRSLTA